jgi:NADH-quinone oxidoreductase subunit H
MLIYINNIIIILYNQVNMTFSEFLYLLPVLSNFILIILLKIICILISVAYFTIAERKVMASIQRRVGPNVEGGPFGLLQPLADGLKLFIKELIIPSRANIFIFLFAPILIFVLSLISWSVIPFHKIIGVEVLNNFFFQQNIIQNIFISETDYGILFLLSISSLNVYGIILGGWASNSKYAFLGALRSAAQMIPYEISIGLTILPVILLTGTFNLTRIVFVQANNIWFFLPLFPSAIIFFISMLAETNRAPFDLPEAEAELVAGYNVEYSSMTFALFFLGEYSNMLLMSTLYSILFFGGWLLPFLNNFNSLIFFDYILSSLILAFKVTFFAFLFILVRATFPRYRYDQLMTIGWFIFLPLTIGLFLFTVSLLLINNCAIVYDSGFNV